METGNSALPPIRQEENPKKGLAQSAREWGQNLAGVFNRKLENERKPGEPKISIHILYCPHRRAEDLKGLRERIEECDVYIPEGDFSTNWLSTLRSVSAGVIMPEQVNFVNNFPLFTKEQLRIIYNTRKLIAMIDIKPEDDQSNTKLVKNSVLSTIIFQFRHNTFDILKERTKKTLRQISVFELKEREIYMLSQFKPKMKELLEDYPYLKEKKEIKVLMTLGSAHTGFFHQLRDQGYEIGRSFNKMPYVYDFSTELIRRYRFGKKVSDELTARATLEIYCCNTIFIELMNTLQDANKRSLFLRRMIGRFGLKEIKGMFEGANNADEFRQLLEEKLKEKGLSIPKSEEELDKFLAKPLPRPNSHVLKQ